jgi:hypothetical protein
MESVCHVHFFCARIKQDLFYSKEVFKFFLRFLTMTSEWQNVSVVSQFMEEVHCELQRIRYVSIMKSVRTRGQNDRFLETVREIDALMDPTRIFTAQVERDVKALLKTCETFIGGLGISDEERLLV